MRGLKNKTIFVCTSLIVTFTYLHICSDTGTNFLDFKGIRRQGNASTTLRTTQQTVIVAIVMHNPVEFLQVTLRSLNESEHKANVWIFKNFVSDEIYKRVLEWYPEALIVQDQGRENSKNIRVRVMEQFLSSKYEVLVTLNSYLILTPDWWKILQLGLEESRGVFSLYGSEKVERYNGICKGSLCFQSWLGDVGSVWRRSLAENMMAETSNLQGSFSRKWESWCHLNSVPLQVVKKSAIAIPNTVRAAFSVMTANSLNINPNNSINEAQLLNKSSHQEKRPGRITPFNVPAKSIAAIMRVRIYRDDKPELTTYELEQWIRYMQYAGVNIVYLYDTYEREGEMLDSWVKEIFEPGEVVYHDWYFNRTFDVHSSQGSAYQHAIEHYKDDCEWHLHFDMDEYPFVLGDVARGFLKRLIPRVLRPEITELSFQNFLFLGYPTEEPWLIGRLQRRLPIRANPLDKPLCLARAVRVAKLHHNALKEGRSMDITNNIARMNQYWGARRQNWEPDTPETLSKTDPDTSVSPILDHLKRIPLISNKLPSYATNRFWDLNH